MSRPYFAGPLGPLDPRLVDDSAIEEGDRAQPEPDYDELRSDVDRDEHATWSTGGHHEP